MPERKSNTEPTSRKSSSRKKTTSPAGVAGKRMTKTPPEERVEVEEKKPDGTRLIRALNARAAILGMEPREVAKELDMSYSYFITLANDPSRFAGINRRFMRNIARFLGINTAMAYQYAGFLEEEDLNVEVTVDRLLAKSREDIERDPIYGVYVPLDENWSMLPLMLRLLIAGLYNEVQQLRIAKALVETSKKDGGTAS